MPEELHGQIDVKQQEIETLQGPADAKKKIREYRSTYVSAVDSGQQALKTAAVKLKSPEAKAFLSKAAGEISSSLASIATRGREIIKAHGDAKEGEQPANVPSMESLSSTLKKRLGSLKSSIESFQLLESFEKDEKKIREDNDKLNKSDGSVSPTEIYKKKKALADKMVRMEPRVKVTSDSKAYWEGIRKEHLALHGEITDEMVALAAPMVDEGTINDFKAHCEAYVKAAATYEKSPSDATKQNMEAAAAKIDINKVEGDVFTEPTRGSENYEQKFYSNLWDTYTAAKESFEKARDAVEAKEKDELMAEAKVAAGAYEKAWNTVIQPDFDKYVAMKPEEQHDSDLEKQLLSQLLESKNLLSKYNTPDAQEKLDYETSELIAKHLEDIGWNIKKIEGLRSEYLNEKDFKKEDISKYVSFPTREGYRTFNERYYSFTPEFFKLSKAEQIRIQQLVEQIAAKNLQEVKKLTAKEELKFLNPEEKMKQLKEMMGEKGSSYWAAYEKLQGDDPESAIPDLQAYVNQSFTEEELEVHAEMIADAKEKIKGFHTARVQRVESLLRDVIAMKYAHGRMVGRPEIKPNEWTEKNEIVKELEAMKKEIADGTLKDFDTRFGQMKTKVRDILAKQEIEETGVLKWLDHLEQASKEKDPEKRKKAFTEFAKEARYYQGYSLAKKYLDYALAEDYKKYAQDVTRDSVLKNMLAEEDFVYKLEQTTKLQYNAMIKEDPSLKDTLTMKEVRDLLIERELKQRYKKAVRRKMTNTMGEDNIDGDSALGLYNNWFPLDEPEWYKPWDYGAEEWDEFQIECAKFAFETVMTLGIGAGAATAGRLTGKAVGKLVLKRLMRQGLTVAEAQILERGGIMALRKAVQEGGKLAGKKYLTRQTLSFAASRLLAGVTAEALTMTTLGTAQQFLMVGPQMFEGHPGQFMSQQFMQNLAFSTIFRGLGVVHRIKPLARAMQKGGALGKAAFLGAETLSGAGGVIVEYAFAKAQGHEFTGKDAFKSMINNYAMAVGMGAIHRPPGSKSAQKIRESYAKETIAAEGKKVGVDFSKPESITSAHLAEDGRIFINDTEVKGFTPEVVAHLPKNVQKRIMDLHTAGQPRMKGPNRRLTGDEQPKGGKEKSEADKKMDERLTEKESELMDHIEGMCPCHRKQMRDMAKIDLAGKTPAEKLRLVDEAIAKIKDYKAKIDKNGHISKATEKYYNQAMDAKTPEGKRVEAAVKGKTVEVEVTLPDGTMAKEQVPVRKELLTPDTVLRLAAGEKLEMSTYDTYLHKHLLENVNRRFHDTITIHKEDSHKMVKVKKAFQQARGKILERIMKGEEVKSLVEKMPELQNLPRKEALEIAQKLDAEVKGATDKVKQGVEVFTTPHAEKNAEGLDISRQYMHETVDKLFDDFATKFEAETGRKVDQKLLGKIKERILLAGIDQHIDNPPQYVSHGFDHSLRVMENVARVVKGSPEAVEGMMTKYKLTESQARLMMLMVGVCHDFGYPTVGNLNKSLHAVTGTYRFLMDIAMPLAEAIGLDMKLPEHQKLIKNFANSIECHSADKVETNYKDENETKQSLSFDRKIVVEIKIPGSDMTYNQEFLYMSSKIVDYPGGEHAFEKDLLHFYKVNGMETTGKVTIVSGKYEGRYLDLPSSSVKGSMPAGIAYRGAEMADTAKGSRHQSPGEAAGPMAHKFDPLLALVRYADNIDMQESRFSEFQKSQPFQRLYERLGAERFVPTKKGEKTVSSAAAEALTKGRSADDVAKLLPKSAAGEKPSIYEGELLSLVKELNGKPPEVRTEAINRLIEVLKTADIVKFGTPPQRISAEARQKIRAALEKIASMKDAKPKPLNKLIQSTIADVIYAEESTRPDLSEADKKHLSQVKKFLNTVNEISFRHFGGCRPVGNVEVQGGSMVITMRPEVIRAYKGLVAAEKVPGQSSPANVPVNVYQVWRGVDAFESLTVNRKKMKLVIKVEGAPDFVFDPNIDVPEGASASGEFVKRYAAWEKQHIQ